MELPPLARGREHPKIRNTLELGITPARAGKSRSGLLRRRWRGELPPLARGRGDYYYSDVYPSGITPARAGKSIAGCLLDLPLWNYPRSRGEESRVSRAFGFKPELPPLARGRDPHPKSLRALSGITPARAGKSIPQ